MRYTRTAISLVSLSIAAAVFSGCSSPSRTGQSAGKSEVSTVVLVLVDSSESVNSEYARNVYATAFGIDNQTEPGTILGNIQPGTQLLCDVITDNSLASATLPVKVVFPAFDKVSGRKLVHEGEMKKARQSAVDGIRDLLRHSSSPATDILGAISLAGDLLNGSEYKRAKRKVLVVLSDMIHQSESGDFTSLRPGQSAIEDILAREKQLNRMPDLTGVEVWVAGAGAAPGGGSSLSQAQQLVIKEFWLSYFKRAGAKISSDQYGAALMNYR